MFAGLPGIVERMLWCGPRLRYSRSNVQRRRNMAVPVMRIIISYLQGALWC